MKVKNKLTLIIFLVLVISLFLYGCSDSEDNNKSLDTTFSGSQQVMDNEEEILNTSSKEKEDNIADELEKDEKINDAHESKENDISKIEYKCRISVRCDAVLNNLDKLDKLKHNLIPKDGIIYESEAVEFQDGESAFDLLLREMKNNEIHLEFEYTPQFESTYVEGIGNLYEFDCGAMSGWVYKVNGEIFSCGCSQYILKNDDYIEWIYMCGM